MSIEAAGSKGTDTIFHVVSACCRDRKVVVSVYVCIRYVMVGYVVVMVLRMGWVVEQDQSSMLNHQVS